MSELRKRGRPRTRNVPADEIARRELELTRTVPLLAIDRVAEQRQFAERDLLELHNLEEKAALGRESFWFFLTQILFPETWHLHYTEAFHKPLCRAIEQMKPGDDLWFFLPRMHRKSYILTIAQSLWRIVRDPNIRILLVGAREETVSPFAELIISAFLPGSAGFEEFQRVYPEFVIQRRSRRLRTMSFIHPKRTASLADPTFRASFLGVTGAGWRCDLLLLDDCVERQRVTSPEMSMKTLGQMLDLMPLKDVTNRTYNMLCGAGTRWAYHDPYGRIMGEDRDVSPAHLDAMQRVRQLTNTRVFIRHALELPGTTCQTCSPHIVEKYPHGEPSMSADAVPVAEPIHTRESVLREFERYMVSPELGESMFWHQWMNICVAPGDRKIQEDWFVQVHIPVWPVARRRIICLDDASKDFQQIGKGDYCVALFGEFDEEGRLLIVNGIRGNTWTKDQFQRKITSWCQTTGWWPHLLVKEKVGADAFLIDLQREFASFDRPCAVEAIIRGGVNAEKKHDLIMSNLQAPLERVGEVVFGSTCSKEIIGRCQYELVNLRQVRHDDTADALSLFMSEKVRVRARRQPLTQGSGWTRVDLSNYGVHRALPQAAAPRPAFTVEQAAERVGTKTGETMIMWTRPFAPAPPAWWNDDGA